MAVLSSRLRPIGLELGNGSLFQPFQLLVWLIKEDVNTFGDRGRAGLS